LLTRCRVPASLEEVTAVGAEAPARSHPPTSARWPSTTSPGPRPCRRSPRPRAAAAARAAQRSVS